MKDCSICKYCDEDFDFDEETGEEYPVYECQKGNDTSLDCECKDFKKYKPRKYKEKNTECDICEYREKCAKYSSGIDCTTCRDTKTHIIYSQDKCIKRAKELGVEIPKDIQKATDCKYYEMLSYGVLGVTHTCVNEKSNCYLDYPVICLKKCGFYEKNKSIYSMKHFEINNISFNVGYGEKYAIDVTNERLDIVGMQVLGRKPIRMVEKGYVRNGIIIKALEYITCNNWRKKHGLPMLKHYSRKTE